MNKPKLINDCRKAPLYILTIIILFVFSAEIVLMIFLENLSWLASYAILLDSFLLVVILFPALYLLVYRPLKFEIEENKTMRRESENSQKMLTTVLDSLDAIVYVADINTYELIFLNKFARDIFGDVTGRICWETLQKGQKGPCEFCSNKELVADDGKIKGMYSWEFQNTVDGHWYDIRDRAIRWTDGRLVRLEVATDVTDKKTAEKEREKLIANLEIALDEVQSLRGIIPICSHCKKIRDDKGFWSQVEVYFSKHSAADFSHSVCPSCAVKHYPEVYKAIIGDKEKKGTTNESS